MNRLLRPRLLANNNLKLWQCLTSKFSVDTGSKEHIDSLVKDKKVVVFMKGTADAPKCGFSNAVVQILQFHGLKEFYHYNVLEDENLRQGTVILMASMAPVNCSFCMNNRVLNLM